MLTVETWQISFLFALIAAGCWKGMILVWRGLNVVQQDRVKHHIKGLAEFGILMWILYALGYILFSLKDFHG